MSRHQNVQELLRMVDGAYAVALAVYRDDLTKYGEEEQAWLEKYCFLYQALTQVKPMESGEDTMILSVIPEEGSVNVSGIPLQRSGSDGVHYAMEFTDAEEYAAMLVPRTLLIRFGAAELASEILREYGWHDADRTAHSPLTLYAGAAADLRELRENQGKLRLAEDADRLEERCLREFQSEEAWPAERFLEAVEMDFSRYHLFRNTREKYLQAQRLGREQMDQVRRNVRALKRIGYTEENIRQAAYEMPQRMGRPEMELMGLFMRRGMGTTRF